MFISKPQGQEDDFILEVEGNAPTIAGSKVTSAEVLIDKDRFLFVQMQESGRIIGYEGKLSEIDNVVITEPYDPENYNQWLIDGATLLTSHALERTIDWGTVIDILTLLKEQKYLNGK